MRWIFLNGELVQRPAAQVSALDRGLLYGYGLFETMRSYGGRVFRLEEHYNRLCHGAARLAMDVPLPLSRIKSLNYLDNLLAREDARRHGADEAILLNTRGFVAEGSASNVFLVQQGRPACPVGRLLTPGVESGALPGIARRAVLELAFAVGLEPVESEVELSVFKDASEAFLTNSVMEVMPLTSLDGRPVGSGRPGPVTERLQRLYRDLAVAQPGT